MTTPLTAAAGAGVEAAREAISSMGSRLGVDPMFDPETAGTGPSFADTLTRVLGDMTAVQDTARDSIAAFVRGEDVELHEVMAASEEAGIALELLVEVRNKIVDAYRTITSMQG